MHDNLDPMLVETLSILQEECAETIQSISKIFRFGAFNVYQKEGTNRQRFVSELGDLQAMIDLVVKSGFVEADELQEAKEKKMVKLKMWSEHLNHE